MQPEAARRALSVFIALMTAIAVPAQAARPAAPAPEMFYHIFVRSFADSDGDRHGDLRGVLRRLYYLQRLGVTTILLTPLYPSQFYHNYFADDFEGVDPEFGTTADLAALVKEVHARGMKIILDQEIQYVSGQHGWRRASQGAPQSPFGRFLLYRDGANQVPAATLFGTNDFYVWPNQRQQIFTVNLAEPKVRAYFARYLKSWVDPDGDGDPSDGVDGFRIDHMMDDLDNAGLLTNLLAGFWAPLIREVRSVNPRVRFIAEQADWGDGGEFLSRGEADMVFAFPIWRSVHDLNAAGFAAAIERSNEVLAPGRSQLIFIENHDTDRFAHDAQDRPRLLRLGAAVTLLTGWTPSLYYGQELGMSGKRLAEQPPTAGQPANADVRDIPLRQAFRWTSDAMAEGAAAWYRQFPEAYDAPDSNAPGDGVSVAEQTGEPGSLLNVYRRLAALRARHRMLAAGSTRVVSQRGALVLIERRSEAGEALVLFNFSAAPAAVDLPRSARLRHRYGEATLIRSRGAARAEAPGYSATVWTVAR